MNEKNFEYLKDNLKYMGFGEQLYADLERGIKSGAAEFQLSHSSVIHQKPFEVKLNFRKGEHTDRYFFNSYHASLQHSNGETKDQVFYLEKGRGITAKEAYNLLDGRAVYKELSNKEGVPYKAWVQLDFGVKDKHNNHEVKQFHENYGFDLKGALGKYALSEMDGGDREKALLQSLQKGNLQAVGVLSDTGMTKMFVQAHPQYKTVTFYDSELRRVPRERLEPYQKVGSDNGKEVGREQKQDRSAEGKQKVARSPKLQKTAKGL